MKICFHSWRQRQDISTILPMEWLCYLHKQRESVCFLYQKIDFLSSWQLTEYPIHDSIRYRDWVISVGPLLKALKQPCHRRRRCKLQRLRGYGIQCHVFSRLQLGRWRRCHKRREDTTLTDSCSYVKPLTESVIPTNSTIKPVMPCDYYVEKYFGNFAINKFCKKPWMYKTIKSLTRIQEGAENTTPIFNKVIDGFLQAEKCMGSWFLLLGAKLICWGT